MSTDTYLASIIGETVDVVTVGGRIASGTVLDRGPSLASEGHASERPSVTVWIAPDDDHRDRFSMLVQGHALVLTWASGKRAGEYIELDKFDRVWVRSRLRDGRAVHVYDLPRMAAEVKAAA